MLQELRSGKLKPKIPDYALDIHLPQGRKIGRGLKHYLTEAAKLAKEDKSLSKKYKQKLLKIAVKKSK